MKKRKVTRKKGRIADSIGQAVPISGFPTAVLKWAKNHGCPAFKGGRVYIDKLIPWLEQNKPEYDGKHLPPKEEIQVLILLETLENRRTQNALFRDEFIRRAKVRQDLTALAYKMRDVLFHSLRNELPPKLEGLRASEMVKYMDETATKILNLWRQIEIAPDDAATAL
jgi:hypothetical protein